MIKRLLKSLAILFTLSLFLSSCYNYTSVVGNGAQGNTQVTEWNNYLLFGLVTLNASDSKAMATGAQDYTVHTRHTFVNGLLQSVTFGIYAPTTTTVTK